MQLITRILPVGILVSLLIGCGYLYFNSYELPHPDTASKKQLGYWLATRDLEQSPHDIQIGLVNRLVNEPSLISSNGDDVKVPEKYAHRLKSNIEILKFVWFQDCVKKYHELSHADQWMFLEKQIGVIENWAIITEQYSQVLYPDAPPDQDYSALLFDEVELWLDKTPRDDHAAAYETVTDAIFCWLGTSSLTEQSMIARSELASRITRELDSGTDIDSSVEFVPRKCVPMLVANTELLFEAWMHRVVSRFEKLESGPSRNEFADRLVEQVHGWGLLSTLARLDSKTDKTNQGPTVEMAAAMKKFSHLVQSWADRAEPRTGESMRELLATIKRRMLVKLFRVTK
ncbi:hypothetical protein N9242_03055 [Vicingaceae bacterium]|nr:hypothetical protein [Vicingaceae bacterium]